MREKCKMIKEATFFCLGRIFRYSPIWSTVLIVVSLISSFSVLVNAKVLELMINTLAESMEIHRVYSLVVMWILSILAMNLFLLLNKYIVIHINAEVERKFLPSVIEKYSRVEYCQFECGESQDLFRHVNASSFKEIVSMMNVLINTGVSIITIIEVVYILSSSIWWFGIITVLLTFPLIYFNIKAAYIEMKQRWTMTRDIRKRYYFQSLFADKNALQEIKTFNSKDYFIDESEKLTQNINDELKFNIGKVTKLKLLFDITVSLFTVLVIGISSLMLVRKGIQLGTYVILLNSIPIYVSSTGKLADNISEAVRMTESINKIFEFFKLDETGMDSLCGNTFMESKLNENVAIEFERVFFSYPGSKNMVLNDISFSLKKGEIVSFVGVNGSGKSTIIKLMCGLYKPDKGIIRINGADISKMSQEQIGNALSIVFQDGQHYMLSLRENVGLGNINEMNDDNLITQALKAAGADEISSGLKDGLDHVLGTIHEDATDLSGGQWQRVLIARAFAGKSDIIIFDEPTSALDPIAECELYNTIYDSLTKINKTSILISHRLASCVFSDKIMVIKDGKIHETGSHNELMNSNGYYAEMFQKQKSWYE